jgi:hypothetical protein
MGRLDLVHVRVRGLLFLFEQCTDALICSNHLFWAYCLQKKSESIPINKGFLVENQASILASCMKLHFILLLLHAFHVFESCKCQMADVQLLGDLSGPRSLGCGSSTENDFASTIQS